VHARTGAIEVKPSCWCMVFSPDVSKSPILAGVGASAAAQQAARALHTPTQGPGKLRVLTQRLRRFSVCMPTRARCASTAARPGKLQAGVAYTG